MCDRNELLMERVFQLALKLTPAEAVRVLEEAERRSKLPLIHDDQAALDSYADGEVAKAEDESNEDAFNRRHSIYE